MYALDMFQNTLVTIKGGAAARIETEMTFVKLCQPKLNGDISAVIERISVLERAVKNGLPSQGAETHNPSESIETPVQKENDFAVPAENTDLSKNNLRSDKQSDAPKAVSVNERQPINQKPAPVESSPQEDAVSQEEFTAWGEFMDVLHKEDIALFGVLNGARGFVRGDFFLIDSPNQTVREFIKVSTHSKAVKKALFEVTGKQYKLGLFKNKNNAQTKRDPLENLISQVQGSINIDLK